MWSAEKISKELHNGIFRVQVRYTNESGNSFVETIKAAQPDGEWPDSQIKRRLVNLNSDTLDRIPLGKVDVATPAQREALRQEPTQEDINRQEFFQNLDKLRQAHELISLGVVIEPGALAALTQTVNQQFRSEYFNFAEIADNSKE